MKKYIIVFLLVLTAITAMAQVKKEGQTYYIYETVQIVGLEFSSGDSYAIIVRLPNYKERTIEKENGKVVIFTSNGHALNYLSSKGYELYNTTAGGFYSIKRKATLEEVDALVQKNKLLVTDAELNAAIEKSKNTTYTMYPLFNKDKIVNLEK